MRNNNRNNRNRNQNTDNDKPVITAIYKVQRSDELLEFLLKKCNTSRNNVKNLLSNHQVIVNGSMVSQFNFMLAKDDEVKISKHPVKADKTTRKRTNEGRVFRINIIYEDDDFIAIDKPQGLLSVESDKESVSAYTYVFEYLKSISPTLRPYVLHRIDKETSGVLVFTKNIKLHSILKLNWNDYVKEREYIAVCEGVFEEKSKKIVNYLKENQNNLVYQTNDPTGQRAVTNYRVIKENQQYSMLRVSIETGRKNQIRVHMQGLNHPIVGDEKYGFTKNPLKRLGLHASKLVFVHPYTKEEITLECKAPNIFYSLFNTK